VIQERTFTEVGGTENHAVDVRLVAATHRALREEVRAGRFREDLMFRLRVVPIFLPALRLRPLDIDLLLRAFVGEFNRQGPRTVAGFSPDAMRALLDHAWPGNVRELRNVVEYAFAVGRGPTITLDELPPEFREVRNGIIRSSSARSPGIAEHDEHGRVAEALARSEGNVERAAASLGLSRTTFWRLRKRLGV
jgi:transcriptional regulator with PAS, ATPase and Fis domain